MKATFYYFGCTLFSPSPESSRVFSLSFIFESRYDLNPFGYMPKLEKKQKTKNQPKSVLIPLGSQGLNKALHSIFKSCIVVNKEVSPSGLPEASPSPLGDRRKAVRAECGTAAAGALGTSVLRHMAHAGQETSFLLRRENGRSRGSKDV